MCVHITRRVLAMFYMQDRCKKHRRKCHTMHCRDIDTHLTLATISCLSAHVYRSSQYKNISEYIVQLHVYACPSPFKHN